MKTTSVLIIASLMAVALFFAAPATRADSFGFYFRSNGFGIGLDFGNYDYYDRYSPGFYDESEVDFYVALEPYGNWVYLGDFGGYVWTPNVSVSWRPYTHGSWSYTSYGWNWVAYEPWGWIPHHYGRWFFHPDYNWIWIPGYEWGPAHVTWAYTNGHYAWAPLPPRHCRYYETHYHYHSHHHYYLLCFTMS